MELKVQIVSFHIEFVGNGHVHARTMAWTIGIVYGGVETHSQSILGTHSQRTGNNMMSLVYRREAMLTIIQKRIVPDS